MGRAKNARDASNAASKTAAGMPWPVRKKKPAVVHANRTSLASCRTRVKFGRSMRVIVREQADQRRSDSEWHSGTCCFGAHGHLIAVRSGCMHMQSERAHAAHDVGSIVFLTSASLLGAPRSIVGIM